LHTEIDKAEEKLTKRDLKVFQIGFGGITEFESASGKLKPPITSFIEFSFVSAVWAVVSGLPS